MLKRVLLSAALTGATVLAGGAGGAAATVMPSGQVMYGHTTFDSSTGTFTGGGGTIEPAYDDTAGTLVYLLTPNNQHVHPTAHNVAPLYLVVYPEGSGIDPSSLNCAHVPADNCPDHGPIIAQVAMAVDQAVYGGGVVGHDHLVGIASSGGDFNVVWEPVLVLFTNAEAATQHITTLSALNADYADGDVVEQGLPQLDFSCSPVSLSAYQHGTPAPTVAGP